jgi:hypothetical protein
MLFKLGTRPGPPHHTRPRTNEISSDPTLPEEAHAQYELPMWRKVLGLGEGVVGRCGLRYPFMLSWRNWIGVTRFVTWLVTQYFPDHILAIPPTAGW